MLSAHRTQGSGPAILRAGWATPAVILLGAAAAACFGGKALLGWSAGALWNLANILLLSRLAALLGRERPDRQLRRAALLFLAKFGLLYPAGIALLWSGRVHLAAFALGFTAVLAVVPLALLWDRPAEPLHA